MQSVRDFNSKVDALYNDARVSMLSEMDDQF